MCCIFFLIKRIFGGKGFLTQIRTTQLLLEFTQPNFSVTEPKVYSTRLFFFLNILSPICKNQRTDYSVLYFYLFSYVHWQSGIGLPVNEKWMSFSWAFLCI
jgi:hypothetical protein